MVVVEAKYGSVWAVILTRIDQIRMSLNGDIKRANDIDSKCIDLFVTGKYLKLYLQLRSKDSEEVECLIYRLEDTVAKKHCVQNIFDYLQEQLTSICYDVYEYRQRLILYSQWLPVDATDGFNGFLYILSTEISMSVQKRSKNI